MMSSILRERDICHWDGRFLSDDEQNVNWWYGDPAYNFCNILCREKYYDRLGNVIEAKRAITI